MKLNVILSSFKKLIELSANRETEIISQSLSMIDDLVAQL